MPDVLYKYRPLRDNAGNVHAFTKALVARGDLYFAPPASLGDAHECKPLIAPSQSEDSFERVKALAEKYVARLERLDSLPGRSPAELFSATIKATNYLSSLVDADGYFEDHAIQKITSKFGVLSLSDDPLCPLLWEHYGGGSGGVCIGFDAAQLPIKYAKPVSYADAVPKSVLGSEELTDILFFYKSSKSHWEREWRVLKKGPGSFIAGCGIIREILFGTKCSTKEVDELQRIMPPDHGCRFGRIVRIKDSYELSAAEL